MHLHSTTAMHWIPTGTHCLDRGVHVTNTSTILNDPTQTHGKCWVSVKDQTGGLPLTALHHILLVIKFYGTT